MARWLIDLAGVKLTVKAKDGPARDIVELALSAMQTERVKTTYGIKLTVKHSDEGWELIDHSNNLRRKLTQPGDVIYHLTDRIVFHVADKAKDVHCLHAAAVANNGHALVIPANSGAGKSSFTTWLVANGFDYLTDELILVDEKTRLGDKAQLDGIARPIQIKAHGLDAIDHLFQDRSLVQKGQFANALPVACLGGTQVAASKQTLSVFVFPKYQQGSTYSFEKLSGAEAGMRLMANHVNARSLAGHGFRAMMNLIRNTPCYSLDYGGFDTLPADFTEQLITLLGAS